MKYTGRMMRIGSLWTLFVAVLCGTAIAGGGNKPIILASPAANTYVAPGAPVTLKALVRRPYPKIVRVDFRANGQLVGSGTNGNWSYTWTPTVSGNYTITAESITRANIIASTSAATNFSVLTVLYDKLGGPGNWGWDPANAYPSWSDSLGFDYNVVTQFIGSLASPVTLKRFEVAMRAFEVSNPGVNIDLSTYTFKLKIWNASSGGFFDDALNPSLASYTFGPINFGSTSAPVGTSISGRPIFHIGWDNLSIPLPSNMPLEISLQASINAAQHNLVNYGSIISGPNMLKAIRIGPTQQTNATISQPMAAKLSVTQ